MDNKNAAYWLGVRSELSCKKQWRLLEIWGSPKELFEADIEDVKGLDYLTENELTAFERSRSDFNYDAEKDLMKKTRSRYICSEDDEYPKALRQYKDMPYGIFVKGRLPEEDKVNVAIVGARNCSIYGRNTARDLARHLAEMDVQVISGMARGIDGFAQRGAVGYGGKSFAVLGSGADVCYPKESYDLYRKILDGNGGIISEQPLGTQALPANFPARNRIISALSDIVVVIEARTHSGSLITANFALEQGKEIMALPGRICDELNQGCNEIIKHGAGVLTKISDIDEIVANISFIKNARYKKPGAVKEGEKIFLEKKKSLVYSCLSLEPKNLDTILKEVPLTYNEVIGTLMSLCLDGYIEEVAKNFYVTA